MRSDENILNEICYILHSHPGLDASHIFITVKEGGVTLSGTVHSPTAKWMAKECIKHISDVKFIRNDLEIDDSNADLFR
jgi:osmotically-inducible protein OsmY